MFQPNLNCNSPKLPLIKISAAVMILLSCFLREYFLGEYAVHPVTIAAVIILIIICLNVIYVSIFEIQSIRKNSVAERPVQNLCTKTYTLEQILKLTEEPIIEIEILHDKKTLLIGTSSDYDLRRDSLFDKEFYIGSDTYQDAAVFAKELAQYRNVAGYFLVIAIDGVEVGTE